MPDRKPAVNPNPFSRDHDLRNEPISPSHPLHRGEPNQLLPRQFPIDYDLQNEPILSPTSARPASAAFTSSTKAPTVATPTLSSHFPKNRHSQNEPIFRPAPPHAPARNKRLPRQFAPNPNLQNEPIFAPNSAPSSPAAFTSSTEARTATGPKRFRHLPHNRDSQKEPIFPGPARITRLHEINDFLVNLPQIRICKTNPFPTRYGILI
jgi:hypothetical protein